MNDESIYCVVGTSFTTLKSAYTQMMSINSRACGPATEVYRKVGTKLVLVKSNDSELVKLKAELARAEKEYRNHLRAIGLLPTPEEIEAVKRAEREHPGSGIWVGAKRNFDDIL